MQNPILTMEFIDNGIEFNPRLEESYAPPKDIGEAKIRGLGILLTKEMTDELDCPYKNGKIT